MLSENMHKDAIQLYEKASELTEQKAYPYFFIANTYMFLNKIELAAKYYKKSIKENPDNLEVILLYFDIVNDYLNKKTGQK